MVRIPPTLVGFALINGFTFGVDLALVTLGHGVLGWPLPLAVCLGYGVALTLAFVLNRTRNFRSHSPVGPEGLRYSAAVAVNLGVILLGVTTGLGAVGVQYQLARLSAGACEGVFMYVAMRWFVFRGDGAAHAARHDAEREALPR